MVISAERASHRMVRKYRHRKGETRLLEKGGHSMVIVSSSAATCFECFTQSGIAPI
jgi:hypothetical protein